MFPKTSHCVKTSLDKHWPVNVPETSHLLKNQPKYWPVNVPQTSHFMRTNPDKHWPVKVPQTSHYMRTHPDKHWPVKVPQRSHYMRTDPDKHWPVNVPQTLAWPATPPEWGAEPACCTPLPASALAARPLPSGAKTAPPLCCAAVQIHWSVSVRCWSVVCDLPLHQVGFCGQVTKFLDNLHIRRHFANITCAEFEKNLFFKSSIYDTWYYFWRIVWCFGGVIQVCFTLRWNLTWALTWQISCPCTFNRLNVGLIRNCK